MKMRKDSELALVCVALAVSVFINSSLRAAVIDLRSAVSAETSLIHHYTFEGTTTTPNNLHLLDRAGTLHLQVFKHSSSPNVVYATGFDALSIGGTAMHGATTNLFGIGAGWYSGTNPIALPATLTVECLVCPRGVPSYANTFLLSSKDGERRGYFLIQTQDLKFQIKIGQQPELTILEPYIIDHWYYVVSTYSASEGKTMVNSYYADLTAGGDLQHAFEEEVPDHYGNGAVLGVGCLFSVSPSYFAPCTIDEAAFYDTVLSVETIGAHLVALRREVPVVEYRELFPNDVNTGARAIVLEGWVTHQGTNGIYFAGVQTVEAETAFMEDLPAIASLPQDTGVTQGYLNNFGVTNQNFLYWTDEMTNRLDVGWLNMVTFDTRSAAKRTMRVALRVDTNATPAEVGDDVWFVGADFDHEPGTSALAIPAALNSTATAWRRHWFDVGGGEWAALDFIPGSTLVRGEEATTLPTNGLVTAFGLLQDYHERALNMRLDNYTIYVRRVYPPPGTLILVR